MKKLYVIVLFLTIVSSPLCAHAGIMSALQWTIACGWPSFRALVGIEQILDNIANRSNPPFHEAPESVRSYVRNQIKPILKKDIKVLVNTYQGPEYYGTNGLNYIVIGVDQATKKTILEGLLQKLGALTDEEKSQLSAINYSLMHEAAHIKNYDLHKTTALQVIIPAIT